MLDTLVQVLRSFWIVWVMVFFSGVVLWAYWPRNRAKIEKVKSKLQGELDRLNAMHA